MCRGTAKRAAEPDRRTVRHRPAPSPPSPPPLHPLTLTTHTRPLYVLCRAPLQPRKPLVLTVHPFRVGFQHGERELPHQPCSAGRPFERATLPQDQQVNLGRDKATLKTLDLLGIAGRFQRMCAVALQRARRGG